MARFEMNPNFDRDMQEMVRRRSQEALDRTHAAVAGEPEDVVRERLIAEFSRSGIKGLDASNPLIASAVREISEGRAVRAT